MKIFKYITLIALMIFNNPLLAMEEQPAVEDIQKESAQEKKAVATIEKLRKKQPELGAGIKIFGSDENPISLELEQNDKGEWYPTTNALTKLLNTYEPLKEYLPGIPKVMVEKSAEAGHRTGAIFVAYRNENQTAEGAFVKGRPLFFLKISAELSKTVPKKLDDLQKGPVGRFGLKAISNPDLPIIVLQEMFFIYQDKNKKNYTIEVMHLAHGEKIVSIFEHGDLTLIQHCAEKLGRALGLFHVEFMNYHNSTSLAEWTTMIHGDFHLNNVFFDKKNSRVYFIDNGDMHEDKLLPFLDLESIRMRSLIVLTSYRDQRMCEGMAERYQGWKQYTEQIEKEEEAKHAKKIADNNANIVIYCLKGYLSAYPLDKRRKVGAYLQQYLKTEFNIELESAKKWSFPHEKDIESFIAKFDAVFTEAYKQP
jgi:hypothetical protein